MQQGNTLDRPSLRPEPIASDAGETPAKLDISRILLIGAGGVGGFIAQHLGLLVGIELIVVVDGDNFERGNTARQGLAGHAIGENKAEATTASLPMGIDNACVPEFITDANWDSILDEFKPTLLISAVDNDKARKLIFSKNDRLPILWGANELWTPQAGLSTPWKPWNPMEAFESAEAAGTACGLQTVHANACAASMAMMLLNMHASPHESPEKLPLFMSKSSNQPIFTMFANEI